MLNAYKPIDEVEHVCVVRYWWCCVKYPSYIRRIQIMDVWLNVNGIVLNTYMLVNKDRGEVLNELSPKWLVEDILMR